MKTAEQIADEAMRDHKGDDVAEGEWWSGPCDEMRQIIVAAIETDRAENRLLLDDAINRLTTTVPLGGVDRLMVRDILVKIRNRA